MWYCVTKQFFGSDKSIAISHWFITLPIPANCNTTYIVYCISGDGQFGDVYEGIYKNSPHVNRKVAIKVLKDLSNSKEFYKEAMVSSSLKHENIVEFLGICTEPNNMIILEFMEGGQLLIFLQSKQEFSTSDLIEMIFDVCKGCAYMELMKFIHRDLAARNCLLTLNRKVRFGKCLVPIYKFTK